jgi:class 3 adenylate cyclase
MNIVELQPMSGGGTRIVQTLRATPKNLIGRLVAKLEMARKAPRNFSRVYSQIDSYLIQGATVADPFGTRTAMTASGKRRLLERTQAIGANTGIDPVVVETFRQFLENASDIEIARIRPIVFAERFQLPPDDVIKACLLGAREGLLVHLWDILCPSCRIPADVQETLSSLKDHAYCSACDLKYELDFASSVELIFRAHPEIRSAETKTYCIGGPAFSAHVVAQVRLAAGERFDLETSLSEGVYRLRGPQLPFGVEMTVSASRGVSRLSLSLLRPPAPGMVPVLRQGSQVLVLDNNTSHDLLLRLERTAGRQQAVTAAAVAGMPLFRELFPNEVLSPGQMVSIASVTLLMVDLVNADTLYSSLGDGPAFGLIRQQLMRIDEIVRRHGGVVVRLLDQGSFCVFQGTPSAIRAAVEILAFKNKELPSARAAIDHGSAMVTTINERLDYFGAIIARVRRLMERAAERELLMPARLAIDVDNAQILKDAGATSHFDEFPQGLRSLPIVRVQCE